MFCEYEVIVPRPNQSLKLTESAVRENQSELFDSQKNNKTTARASKLRQFTFILPQFSSHPLGRFKIFLIHKGRLHVKRSDEELE